MKKTRKKVLGLLGLSLVAGMTVAAAMMPAPGASATSSVTDTLKVRVIGNEPVVLFDADQMATATSDPNYWVYADYQQVDDLILKVENLETGNEYNLGTTHVDYGSGDLKQQTNLNNYGGNYGEYYFTATGTGLNGGGEDYYTVTYYPVILEQQENGEYTVDANETDDTIEKIEVTIRGTVEKTDGTTETYNTTQEYGNGDVVSEISDLPKGNYTISIAAYDRNGNIIYSEYTIRFTSLNPPAAGAPDTGSFFQNLNLASEDFLITGLIVFFVIGIVAIGVIARGRGNTKSLKKRR